MIGIVEPEFIRKVEDERSGIDSAFYKAFPRYCKSLTHHNVLCVDCLFFCRKADWNDIWYHKLSWHCPWNGCLLVTVASHQT